MINIIKKSIEDISLFKDDWEELVWVNIMSKLNILGKFIILPIIYVLTLILIVYSFILLCIWGIFGYIFMKKREDI